ncbi:nucleoside hydrolase [Acidimicrobiaceae bacterium]|jgi:purine nucleosidase|nr:nucleoside hydrolase [Acidimicrobiaceae bacterium]|tara:strand:+ start:2806 stop:3738 length:933 start_codon:yes stop_codon:yes gene_type:complete
MKLIIDTDPGTDDAVAILIALAYFSDEEILGITTVAGNVKVEIGTNNALRILEHADRNKIPVYEGEKAPLERKLLTAEWVHGTDGLNFVPFPSPSKEKEKKDAVTFLKESLDNSDEKVNLCVLGPMTNIGKLLQKFPEISTKIEKIIFMGGGAGFGNHTPVAEFNILVDPEAANIVFKSGVELVMMGLDVTHQAISTKERLEKIISTNTETGKFLADLMGSLSDIDIVKEKFPNGTPVHDAFVTAYLVDNSLTSGEFVNVEVETKSDLTLGQTVVDINNISGRQKNVFWMNKVDDEKLFEIITETAKRIS